MNSLVIYSTYMALKRIGHGESAGDPAVGVHNMLWYSVNYTRNRLADILRSSNNEATGEQ